MQKEHDVLTNTIKKAGIKVLYIKKLLLETLETVTLEVKVKKNFIKKFLKNAVLTQQNYKKIWKKINQLLPNKNALIIDLLIGGVIDKNKKKKAKIFTICILSLIFYFNVTH